MDSQEHIDKIRDLILAYYNISESDFLSEPDMVELKEYLRSLNIKSSQRKIIKKHLNLKFFEGIPGKI